MSAVPLPAMRPWTDAVVLRTLKRTARVVSLFFANPFGPFLPGQHVDVRLVADDGYEARRSYSIASAPGGAEIELMVDGLDDGEVSPFLHDVLQPGDTIGLRGPIGGHFVWTEADGGPLLLVAGGSGIAPLMSMLRHRAVVASHVPTLLLYGARSRVALVYGDELATLAAADPRLRFLVATSRDTPGREGDFAGRIDASILRDALARWGEAPRQVYVCGSTGFVETVTSALVDAAVDPARVRTERYGGGG